MNKQINQLLSRAHSVAIIGHRGPDYDALSSIIGVHEYVKSKYNCTVHCFADCDCLSSEAKMLLGNLKLNPKALDKYDLCFCVDCADKPLLEKYIPVFDSSSTSVCIDHHMSNTHYADLNFVENVSSNSEIVYYMLKQAKFDISKSLMGRLYVGMHADTNNFTVPLVNENTFLALADFNKAGVDLLNIRQYFFGGKSLPQFKLLASAMNSLKMYCDNKIMLMEISKDEFKLSGGSEEDLGCIINSAFSVKDALCAILITYRKDKTHVSLRGKDGINVNAIATKRGGGGHLGASAFKIDKLTRKETNSIINELIKQIKKLPQKNNKIFD